MAYITMPQASSAVVTNEQIRNEGLLVEYSASEQTFLLAYPNCSLAVGSLRINNTSFYELVSSRTGVFQYWAVQYTPSTGTYYGYNDINFTDSDDTFLHTVTVDGVTYNNYQLRTWYNSPWTPATVMYENEADTVINFGYSDSVYPITYSASNGTLSGPSEAAVGENVTVSCTFPDGYYMANPENDIAVTSGGESVPFTWDAANSQITFTMPEGAVTVHVTASLIPTYPITYRPTRVTLDGPATAAVGDTVNVDCAFPEGYGIKTTDSITVTCNRVPVPFSWDAENQRVTFTMPDPTA